MDLEGVRLGVSFLVFDGIVGVVWRSGIYLMGTRAAAVPAARTSEKLESSSYLICQKY